jgi:translation initiation factor 2 beta subunit (eIF-2beta)/eIF-5
MHTQFKRKMSYQDFMEKRRMAEHIKINLNEEVRNLNRWIGEYEEWAALKVAKAKEEATFAY